jgi:hypothetical protein
VHSSASVTLIRNGGRRVSCWTRGAVAAGP